MGKGDRKTRRGKINRSSYGNSRPRPLKKNAARAASATAAKAASHKKP